MDHAVINSVWGFDPSELLQRIEFPNDENEYKIRHSHLARCVRMKNSHLARD